MRQWVQQVRRSARKGFLYAVASSATVVGLAFGKASLRNDSQNSAPWPSSSPHIGGRSPGDGNNNISRHKVKTQTSLTVDSQDEDVPLFEDEDSAAWATLSARFAVARESISAFPWSKSGDRIVDRIVPEWAQQLPGYIAKMQDEMEMRPGSLADEIWQEAQDPSIHPEITRNAKVRLGKDLCAEELAFVKRRKQYTTQALARYLDIPEAEIDPRDVPTIALCGSGGGLRALVSGAASYLSAQESGLFDCTTYTAGISGSCWLQALYNSSLGFQRHDRIIEHLKKRIGVHIAYPPAFLDLLTRAPTNKFILSGTIERLRGDKRADFGIVDVYGVLLATRLLISKNEISVDERDMKLSQQQRYLRAGANPLPIYSAVRHEMPIDEQKTEEEKARGELSEIAKEKAKKKAWFQWFEFSPYEVFCEELGAGIPTWSVGRHFEDGKSRQGNGIPELRIPFLFGIWGSAFCATLAHYYKEVRPIIKDLAGFGGIDQMLEERNDELVRVHPIDPGAIPNFTLGMEKQLPPSTPESLLKSEHLELMDAGMSNNLPIYPLLRRGRHVDIIVCFDASADIEQENWLAVADGYAKQQAIKGWPIGVGWPRRKATPKEDTHAKQETTNSTTRQQSESKSVPASGTKQEMISAVSEFNKKVKRDISEENDDGSDHDREITYCNVWVGSVDPQSPKSKRIVNDPSVDPTILLPEHPGITMVYFPFLPNPKVPGVAPDSTPFLSTWNFIYSPEEIDRVVQLARANFAEGEELTKRAVRAIYEKNKTTRLMTEREGKVRRSDAYANRTGNVFG